MSKRRKQKVDIEFERHGSITLVHPVSDAAQDFVSEDVHVEGWQWMGNRFAAEPRMAYDLATIADERGLVVGWS